MRGREALFIELIECTESEHMFLEARSPADYQMSLT